MRYCAKRTPMKAKRQRKRTVVWQIALPSIAAKIFPKFWLRHVNVVTAWPRCEGANIASARCDIADGGSATATKVGGTASSWRVETSVAKRIVVAGEGRHGTWGASEAGAAGAPPGG